MKFMLNYKTFLLLALIGATYNPHTTHATQDHDRVVVNRAEYESKFLHEAVHNLLTYIQGVWEGKKQFFDLENIENYQVHIDRFKESLKSIKKITNVVEKEARNTKAHSSKEYTATTHTVATMAKLLRDAQQKWVDAVDSYRGVVTLGGALALLQGMANETKRKITEELIPALEGHLSNHEFIEQIETIKKLVFQIFNNADEHGNKYGPRILIHRFRYP